MRQGVLPCSQVRYHGAGATQLERLSDSGHEETLCALRVSLVREAFLLTWESF